MVVEIEVPHLYETEALDDMEVTPQTDTKMNPPADTKTSAQKDT